MGSSQHLSNLFTYQTPTNFSKKLIKMKTTSAIIVIVAAILANVANAQIAVNPAKPYSYAYEVVDPAGGNAYGHRETSSGTGCVEGEYRVVLPDTRTQIVKYSVCPDTGYVAEVSYEGSVAPYVAIPQSERLVAKPVYRPGRA